MRPKVAVLVSGTGSLLEAMFTIHGLPVDLVLSDRPCRGIEFAKERGIQWELVSRALFCGYAREGSVSSAEFDQFRDAYTKHVRNVLFHYNIRFIAMAGFMTVFAPVMFRYYGGNIVNTHPSLLPAFKGDHAVRDALAYGVKITGCTVHIATPELDSGRILGQAAVPVLNGDTEAVLHERIKVEERKLYPQIIRQQLALL